MEIGKVEEKAAGKEAVIFVDGEGNFMGQGLRGELLKNKSVSFAVAKLEHPLKKTAVISVKTSKGSAISAVKDACGEIGKSAREFSKKVSDELK
ncbi:MAG: RpoL/Rpb11 RNA polymerase subunit family protein [archaeon]